MRSLEVINAKLGLGLVATVKGDMYKGWRPSDEGGGLDTFYLDQADCKTLAMLFTEMAEAVGEKR